jgi:hypothetical protein
MRGADLESNSKLLDHLQEQLAALSRHAGALAEEQGHDSEVSSGFWFLSADIASLCGVVAVLRERESNRK